MTGESGRQAQGFSPETTPPVLRAKPEAIATMADLRHRELLTISNRLGRVEKPSRARAFGTAATILLGAVLGAAFGLIPFLSADPGPSNTAKLIYFGSMGVCVLACGICGLAWRALKKERADDCAAIKADLDGLLAAYDADEDAAETAA